MVNWFKQLIARIRMLMKWMRLCRHPEYCMGPEVCDYCEQYKE